MKLSLIGPIIPFRGGIAHFTTRLVQEISASCDLQTISFQQLYPSWLYPGISDKEPNQEVRDIEALYILNPINPVTWWKTARTIRQFDPEALIIEWWTTFLAPAYLFIIFWLRRSGIPVLFLIHNVLPHELKSIDSFLASLVLKNGQGFIVMTKKEKERLLTLFPTSAPVEICPHPTYDFFVKHRIEKQEARRKLGLPKDLPILLFFGIVRPYKGVEYLVQSLVLLARRGIEIFALIVGEWWMDQSYCRELIHHSGLDNRVRIVDRYVSNEEVGYYFSAADLFVAPYIGGTQSGSAKIALAFNMPMIVTEHIADGIQNVNPDLLYVISAHNADRIADAVEQHLRKGIVTNRVVNPVSNQPGWEDLSRAIQLIVKSKKKSR